jgi:hypothetical protein
MSVRRVQPRTGAINLATTGEHYFATLDSLAGSDQQLLPRAFDQPVRQVQSPLPAAELS